jgi:hypothetical protein
MKRGDTVRLNSDARINLVDPLHEGSVGRVVSVSGTGLIVLVRWEKDGRSADYASAWLDRAEDGR